MNICGSCNVEARAGSGVCHICGRPSPQTVAAAAAIGRVSAPQESALAEDGALQAPTGQVTTTLTLRPARRLLFPLVTGLAAMALLVGAATQALVLSQAAISVPSSAAADLSRGGDGLASPAGPDQAVGVPADPVLIRPVAASGAAATESFSDQRSLLERSEQALMAQAWDESIALLEQARALGPDSDDLARRLAFAHRARAGARLDAADLDGAASDFELAAGLGDVGAAGGLRQVELARHYAAAESAWGLNDSLVVSELEAVYALDPSFREVGDKLYAALLGRAAGQVRGGELEAARATLERARALAPERGEALAALATLDQQPEPESGPGAEASPSSSSGPAVDWRSLLNERQRKERR